MDNVHHNSLKVNQPLSQTLRESLTALVGFANSKWHNARHTNFEQDLLHPSIKHGDSV
jgi:hypothetical protein